MIDVVLVHGFPFDGRLWAGTAQALTGTARVHALDLPGFGSSAEPPAESMDAMADAVRRYVDGRKIERFVLGGLSMGGYVTFAYWRRHARERRPAGLILADTKAEADAPDARRTREETAATVRKEGTLKPYADRMIPKLVAPQASDAARGAVRTLIEAQRVESVAVGALAMRDRPNSVAILGGIDVPALVLCGEHDAITPIEGMRDLTSQMPKATFQAVPGAGHMSNLENPGAFDAAVRRFLQAF